MARQELFKEYFLLTSVEAQIQAGDILENIFMLHEISDLKTC